jgi:hypothetical protein
MEWLDDSEKHYNTSWRKNVLSSYSQKVKYSHEKSWITNYVHVSAEIWLLSKREAPKLHIQTV